MSLAWTSRFSRNPGRESWSEFCLEFFVHKGSRPRVLEWVLLGILGSEVGSADIRLANFKFFDMTKWPRTHLNLDLIRKVRPTLFWFVRLRSSICFQGVRPTVSGFARLPSGAVGIRK